MENRVARDWFRLNLVVKQVVWQECPICRIKPRASGGHSISLLLISPWVSPVWWGLWSRGRGRAEQLFFSVLICQSLRGQHAASFLRITETLLWMCILDQIPTNHMPCPADHILSWLSAAAQGLLLPPVFPVSGGGSQKPLPKFIPNLLFISLYLPGKSEWPQK